MFFLSLLWMVGQIFHNIFYRWLTSLCFVKISRCWLSWCHFHVLVYQIVSSHYVGSAILGRSWHPTTKFHLKDFFFLLILFSLKLYTYVKVAQSRTDAAHSFGYVHGHICVWHDAIVLQVLLQPVEARQNQLQRFIHRRQMAVYRILSTKKKSLIIIIISQTKCVFFWANEVYIV